MGADERGGHRRETWAQKGRRWGHAKESKVVANNKVNWLPWQEVVVSPCYVAGTNTGQQRSNKNNTKCTIINIAK